MACSDDSEEDIIVPKKWYEKLPREAWSRYVKVKQPDPWFEVYSLTNDVYAIYEDGQFEEVISYLVLGEEKAILIDSGNGVGDIKAVVERLTDLSVMILNTHTHGDHVGGNYQFKEVAVLDSPYSRERAEKGQTKDQMGHHLEDDMVWKPLPPYFNIENWRIRPFKTTRWLNDGDKVDLVSRTLEIIHTPGHSPDSICILDRKDRLFWTGDSFYPAPIYIYASNTSLDEFINSFRRMTSLMKYYDWVIPSHNEPYVENKLIKECYLAAKNIRAGAAGPYKKGVAAGVKVHRFDYDRFSLIVRAGKA